MSGDEVFVHPRRWQEEDRKTIEDMARHAERRSGDDCGDDGHRHSDFIR